MKLDRSFGTRPHTFSEKLARDDMKGVALVMDLHYLKEDSFTTCRWPMARH